MNENHSTSQIDVRPFAASLLTASIPVVAMSASLLQVFNEPRPVNYCFPISLSNSTVSSSRGSVKKEQSEKEG
jgi:hypothetical protein